MAFFGGGGASVDLASPSAIGSTTPNTGAFTTLSFAPAANATGLSSSSYSLTGSNDQSLISLSGTWNTTGTPTGILFNVTDTASNSNSLLLDLKVGGITRMRVGKDGVVRAYSGFELFGGTSARLAYINWDSFTIRSDATFSFSAVTTPVPASEGDTCIRRDGGAGIIGLHKTTTAHSIRIYNTRTNSTNFERVNFRWSSNEFILDAEKGSAGGSLRGIKLGSDANSLLGFYGVTPVDQPATVTDPTGGGTQDAEARTAINAIIDRLQELGLIA